MKKGPSADLRRQTQLIYKNDTFEGYSSGPSGGSMFLEPINTLGEDGQKQRILFMWQKLYQKLRGAVIVVNQYNKFVNV